MKVFVSFTNKKKNVFFTYQNTLVLVWRVQVKNKVSFIALEFLAKINFTAIFLGKLNSNRSVLQQYNRFLKWRQPYTRMAFFIENSCNGG